MEGLTIVHQSNGTGYLMASAQSVADPLNSYFTVYERQGNNAFLKAFRVVAGPSTDGCSRTDGIAAVAADLGPSYPFGLFVCQDDSNTTPGMSGNQDFKFVRLEKIVTLEQSGPPPPPPPPPPPAVFLPDADARVVKGSPTTNFGDSTTLMADKSPQIQSFLQFTVSGVTAPVVRARLRLFVTDPSGNGSEIYPAATGWGENTITWRNRPGRTGPLLADAGAVSSGAYREWDLKTFVTGDDTYAFNVAADSSDGTDFNSKEASYPPQLVLDF